MPRIRTDRFSRAFNHHGRVHLGRTEKTRQSRTTSTSRTESSQSFDFPLWIDRAAHPRESNVPVWTAKAADGNARAAGRGVTSRLLRELPATFDRRAQETGERQRRTLPSSLHEPLFRFSPMRRRSARSNRRKNTGGWNTNCWKSSSRRCATISPSRWTSWRRKPLKQRPRMNNSKKWFPPRRSRCVAIEEIEARDRFLDILVNDRRPTRFTHDLRSAEWTWTDDQTILLAENSRLRNETATSQWEGNRLLQRSKHR